VKAVFAYKTGLMQPTQEQIDLYEKLDHGCRALLICSLRSVSSPVNWELMNHPRNHDRTAFAAYAAVASHGKRLKAEMDDMTVASKTDLLSVQKEFPPSEDVIMYLAARTMVE
jgi:hypothetical protein